MINKTKRNKTWMTFGVFGVLLLLGMGMVFAYQGDQSVQGPDYSDERHEAMTEAFDNVDYGAWAGLMAETGRNSKVMDVVTAENFEVFVQAHEALENGNVEIAQQLRAELGLGQGKMAGGQGESLNQNSGMKGMNKGSGMKSGMQGYNGECPYGN